MHRMANVGLLILLSLAACAHTRPSPSRTAPGSAAGPIPTTSQTAGTPTPHAVSPGPMASPAPEHPSRQATQASGEAAHAEPAATKTPAKPAATRAPLKATVADAAKAAPQRGSGAVTSPTKDEHAASPETESSVATAAQKPAASLALDLAALEQRLRDTHAIGVFTKLSLKNQVDDLLGSFREFHSGRLKATLADLRQRYDLMLLKVLSLLQDGDPPLAAAIAASRDAIWGILVDPEKFQKV